jgi:glycosyltransferase involved in cell wall biosynthesis
MIKSMMRVAIVIDTLRVGGAQKLVSDFTLAAADYGIEPTIVCLHKDIHPIMADAMKAAGVRMVEFPSPSLLNPARFLQLTRFLRNEKFDLIHSHLSYSNILCSLAGFFIRCPVIVSLHNTDFDSRKRSGRIARMEAVILRYFARRMIAVGYGVADVFHERLGTRKVDVIPNGVPAAYPIVREARQKLRREIMGEDERVLLLAVGRFVPAKGYDDMLDAFALLHERNPHTFLAIAGSGHLFNQVTNRISEMHLEGSVACLGTRSDIPQLLAASDIFVSSSHWEGLPVAILEAMMAGLPIVATAVGDIPKVVTAEAGVIVPPQRPDCLAEALDTLIGAPDKARAMGQAARLRAMQEYSLDTWMRRHVSVYSETLSAAKG